MGQRHNVLTDEVFSKSKYIDLVERTIKEQLAREKIAKDKNITNDIKAKVDEEMKQIVEDGNDYRRTKRLY